MSQEVQVPHCTLIAGQSQRLEGCCRGHAEQHTAHEKVSLPPYIVLRPLINFEDAIWNFCDPSKSCRAYTESGI